MTPLVMDVIIIFFTFSLIFWQVRLDYITLKWMDLMNYLLTYVITEKKTC